MMLERLHKNEISCNIQEGLPTSDCNKLLIPGGELPSTQKNNESENGNFPRAGIDSYLMGGSLLGEIDHRREQGREEPVDLRFVRKDPNELNNLLFAPEKDICPRENIKTSGEDKQKTEK